MGIEHAILPEKGDWWWRESASSVRIPIPVHTGLWGHFPPEWGQRILRPAWPPGELWFKVPGAIKFVLTGKPSRYVSGKDIIIHIIGKIGVDGALYKSMEFTGDGIANLSMDDRFTMANMAIEAGAKNGIFPVDETTASYMKEHARRSLYRSTRRMRTPVYDAGDTTIDLAEVRADCGVPPSSGERKDH